MQKITTFLTYSDRAEEAATFYVALFKDSKVTSVMRAGEAVISVSFQLAGQEFIALNGGPSFSFAQGISLFVSCDTQKEIDELYEQLSAGGEKQPCGWLRDKFGVSWQVVPPILGELLGDKDPETSQRVLQAMLKMQEIEIPALERAYRVAGQFRARRRVVSGVRAPRFAGSARAAVAAPAPTTLRDLRRERQRRAAQGVARARPRHPS